MISILSTLYEKSCIVCNFCSNLHTTSESRIVVDPPDIFYSCRSWRTFFPILFFLRFFFFLPSPRYLVFGHNKFLYPLSISTFVVDHFLILAIGFPTVRQRVWVSFCLCLRLFLTPFRSFSLSLLFSQWGFFQREKKLSFTLDKSGKDITSVRWRARYHFVSPRRSLTFIRMSKKKICRSMKLSMKIAEYENIHVSLYVFMYYIHTYLRMYRIYRGKL